MMELMVAHPHIFWLSLDGLLLAVEMLGGNGYLLWGGVAVVTTGLMVWLVPLGWERQGVMFAILMLLAIWLWWKWLSRRVREQKCNDSHLNQRGQQPIGRHFVLESPLVNGRGHIRVGDGSWPVSVSEDLGTGTHAEVIAIERITLHIRAVSPQSPYPTMIVVGEIFDNRAVSAVIARAGIRQCQQLVAHELQLLSVLLDLRHLLQRAAFDVGTVPLRVAKQIHQLAALFQVKAHLPRLAQ